MSLESLASKIVSLPHNQRARAIELLRLQKKTECEESYFEFFKAAWRIIEPSTKLTGSPHIEYICNVLERQVLRQAKGLAVEFDTIIINVPPSCSKSSIVTKIFPAWVWIHSPWAKIVNSSYSASLALSHSVKTRDILTSEWFTRNWSDIITLKGDENSKSNYANNQGGERRATSTGGTLTGFHAHILIVDDPINPKQAESDAERNAAKEFWEVTVPSRVLENSFKILVMQRLHTDDPTGLELANKEARVLHVCLPAEMSETVKPSDAIGIYKNGLLDEVRLPGNRLRQFKRSLGSYAYAGQYEQLPVPKGGGIIKKDWFQYVEEYAIPPGIVWDMWIDGAYTKNLDNDPTGIMIAGYNRPTKEMYVRYFTGEYLEMPEVLKRINELARTYNLSSESRIYFEPKASGKSMKQMIKSIYSHLNPVEIRGKLISEGKNARANIAAPRYESGRIKHVIGAWNDTFEHQLTGFPNVKHDEPIDLIGYATDKYFQRPEWTGQST